MNIRHTFMTIAAVLLTSAVFADSSSVTSKKYVDDFMAGYQNKIPGSGADKLMIYDDTDGISAKQIVSSLGDDTGATNIPDVGAVKDALDDKQDKFNGTAGYVMTGMGTNRPGEVGERAIYGMTFYGNSLVTAENVNDGVINAVNSSLIRVDENGNPSDSGTLWEINTDLFAIGVLPAGYTQLEWIESTGTQYIDTGYVMNNASGIKIEVDDTETNSPQAVTAAYFVGARSASKYQGYFTRYYSSNGTLYSVWAWNGEGSLGIDIQSEHSTVYINYMNDRKFMYTNGIETYNRSDDLPVLIDTTLSTYLFAINMGGTPSYVSKGKIYSAQFTEGSEVVHNFVPAKNSSNVAGMYDTVSGQFFTSPNGNNFIAGPAVAN